MKDHSSKFTATLVPGHLQLNFVSRKENIPYPLIMITMMVMMMIIMMVMTRIIMMVIMLIIMMVMMMIIMMVMIRTKV